MNKKVLIIGGNSGIGRRLKYYFNKNNYKVFATARNKKNLIKYDLNNVTKKKFLNKNFFGNLKFDYVLFVAAITTNDKEVKNKFCTFGNLDYLSYIKLLSINCFSQIKTFENLKKNNNLEKKSKIIFFSSLAGSITNRGELPHNKPYGNMFYRISKAALNCGVKNLSYDFKKNYIIVSMHPGYVKTKSGGKKADLSVDYASRKIFKTIIDLKKKDNGKFLDLKGKKILW